MEKVENQTIITYKYYDGIGRRLAILGKKLDDTHVGIAIICCSKKDSFCKREAREAFKSMINKEEPKIYGEKAHPQNKVITFGGDEITNWKKEFYRWCKDNYFKKEVYTIRVPCNIERFNRNGQIIPIKIKPTPQKLDLI